MTQIIRRALLAPTYLLYNSNNQIISTGAVNSLANPSLEASPDSITLDNWYPTIYQDNGSVKQSSAAALYGKQSLNIQSSYQAGTTGDSALAASQKVPVQANTVYQYSAYVKTANLGGKAYLNVEELDASGNHLSWQDNLALGITGTNDWTQESMSITTGGNTAYLVLTLEIRHDQTQFGGDAYFDGVQLEMGSQPTEFKGHTDFRYFTDSSSGSPFEACMVTKAAGETVEYKNNNYGTPAAIIGDPAGLKAETNFSWDASDHLRSLTTPEQVKLGDQGRSYLYEYDAIGNMTKATDPLGRETNMDYYYNQLENLTQPGGDTVSNVWNPVNLNKDTNIEQTGNSKTYTHDSSGNTISESNQIGVADNRIYNSGFDGSTTPSAPTFTRGSSAFKSDGTQVTGNTPRYETGQYGQSLTLEEGTTNLLNSQGGGASTDWTKWGHWGNRSYWSSESQTSDPNYGNVYAGVNANSTATYLFDYYPYSVTSGASYTLSAKFKASQAWTGNITAYMIRSSDGAVVGFVTLPVSLTTGWNQFNFPMSANQTLSASVGIGFKFSNLPTGVTLSASRPQLEQLPYATTFTDSTRSGESLTLPTTVFTPAQGTIEAWVKPSRNPGQALQMITDVAETGNNGLILSLGTDGKFFIQAGTGTGVILAKSTTTASQGTWYHVAGKWEGTGVSIYVNGVKEGTTAGSTNIVLSSTPTIGRESQIAQRWFDGLIDDVRISSIARTDTEIQTSYTSGQALAADIYTTYKLNFDNNLNVSAASFQPDNWSPYTPAGSVNQVEYDSTAPVGGSYVLHLNPGSNSYTYQSTDYIPVNNNPYILSSDIKTNGSSSTNGAALNIYWYDSNHNPVTAKPLETFFNLKTSASWQRYISPNITPPPGAAYAKVMAINYGALDSYFDNIQFEQSSQARGYNYLDNSTFMRGNVRWNPSDAYATVANDSGAFSDGYDGIVNLPSTGSSYLESQVVTVVNQGQSYSLAGFMSTQGVVAGTGGGARLHAVLLDTSGNVVSDAYSPLITGDTPWTKYAFSFKPTVTGKVKVRLEIYNAQGIAKFDNIRLSSGNLITSTNYDNNKNYVTSIKNQLNNTMTFVNDAYGQVTKITAPGGETVDYSYDGQEQLRSVKDNANNTTTYLLDANGNVTDSSLLAGASTYNHSSFSYDVHNNLLSETDANGNTTGFKYDEGGRLQIKTNPDGSTVTLSYDALENVSQILFSDGKKYNYTYDLEGRRKTVKVYSNTTLLNEFTYGYDAIGNLTSYVEKDGNNTVLTQLSGPPEYSSKDELKNFTLTTGSNTISYIYQYTKNGLLDEMTGDGKTFSFIYDDGDNLINRTNPDQTKDSYTYNEANQILGSQTVQLTIGTDLYAQALKWGGQYTYNTDGKLSQVSGTRPSGTNFTESYTYNDVIGNEKLSRLTKATITDGATPLDFDYSYDPAGNLLTMDVANGTAPPTPLTFMYDADNRITNSGFTYDSTSGTSNGNLTSAVINGKNYIYVYDSANRLTTVKDGSGAVIASYTYGGDGQRLTKTIGTTTTTYHYFQGQLMYETLSTDASNVIRTLYLRSANGALLGVRLYNGSGYDYYYYHYNSQGDVVAVTDSNGAVYRQYVYDPYGNVISVKDGSGASVDITNDSGFNNAYTYRGYRYDSETGLYFLNSRYYAAGIGRFLTKDNVVGHLPNPQTLNRYAYALGDPVNYVDPNGNFAWAIVGAIGGAVIGGIAGAIYSYENEGSVDWRYVVGGAIGGALIGAGAGYLAETAVAAFVGASGAAVSNPSTQQQLQNLAVKANNAVTGNGPVAGTLKHSVFQSEVQALNNPLLRTEVSFKNGVEVVRGTRGSVRLDVVEYGLNNTIKAIYDFKTGNATLTTQRMAQINSHLPNLVPIFMIK